MVIVIVLAVVLIFVPLLLWGLSRARSGRRGVETSSGGRGADMATWAVFLVVTAVFGIGIPLFFLADNHSTASAKAGSIKLTKAEEHGRELFGEHCALCHTLKGANAIGKVGPNLDILGPGTVDENLHTINNGCLPNAPKNSDQYCLGYGVMPAQEVTGEDATDVAQLIVAVAGKSGS